MNYKFIKDFIVLLAVATGLFLGLIGIIYLIDYFKITINDNFSRLIFTICLIILITALVLWRKLFKKRVALIKEFAEENGFEKMGNEKIPAPASRHGIEIEFIAKKEESFAKIYLAGLNWELGTGSRGAVANSMNQRFFGAFIGTIPIGMPKIELADLNLHQKLINLIPRHTFESVEFNNRFYFTSNNVKSSYEIITPDFMARVLDLNLKEFSLSIKDGYAQLLFEHFDDKKVLSETYILFKELLSKIERLR